MIFNSIQFAIFLPVVFLLYWFVFDKWISKSPHQLKLQNAFVLVASYVFYGWWDWKFLILIAFTSLCSYLSGILMREGDKRRNLTVMWVNIVINIAILGMFKYYDFFATEFARLFGLESDKLLLHLILPVGISFYTFQALSYSIDIYRQKMQPTRDAVAFFAYIAFFPQLVAGPIERATNLLPQFLRKREFDYQTALDGARQILWGLFKKMVVADTCASYVDMAFGAPAAGSVKLMGAIFFTFQIYGDFSGYSDIAIGTAKLFGVKLMRNFANPYFSRDIAEFWRRWHMSLTTWFRDYIYIPLGGSRTVKWKVIRNTFIIFTVSGFWHGANWTFIGWGLYHAALFMPLIILGKNRKYTDVVATGRWLPSVKELGQMTLTFMLAVIGWILFRATGIPSAIGYFQSMLSLETLTGFYKIFTEWTMLPIGIMLVVEWLNRQGEHALQGFDHVVKSRWVRYFLYALAFVAVIFFRGDYAEFIYFQF
ncbi:MAG: MBOAT family O-acyltransferase [Bacteroidales bacterium]|nr:MBOAT family O-acyltransferase [Bacteroidales bacterium]